MTRFFDTHAPSGSTVIAHGETVSNTAEQFGELYFAVSAQHAKARSNVHGQPGQAMASAPQQSLSALKSLYRRALVAGRALDEYGQAISRFNSLVEDWNSQIAHAPTDDAAEKVYENQRPMYRKEESVLSDEARDAKRLLTHWDDDAVIKNLWAAGALPVSAIALFSDLNLRLSALDNLPAYLRGLNFDTLAGLPVGLLKDLLTRARGLDMDPEGYAGILQAYYVTLAANDAGIDLASWDPSLGAGSLRGTIENVYTYYGDLYLDHPWMQWAGMANMIGPSFAGGFFDLNLMAGVASSVAGDLDQLPGDVSQLPEPLGGIVFISRMSAADVENEASFFETTLLGMQKDIFIDMAASHEAYLDGGMDAINEMAQAGLFDNGDPQRTVQAWEQIDEGRRTGNTQLLDQGNRYLLYREQHDIIQDNYEDMYNREKTGPAFTYMMGVVGGPSIPGAQTLAEVDPLQVEIPVIPNSPYSPDVVVDTPLPAGNLADFNTRWNMIEDDTLSTYLDLIHDNPDVARQIIGSDIHDRVEDQRLVNRVDDVIARTATNWDVHWQW